MSRPSTGNPAVELRILTRRLKLARTGASPMSASPPLTGVDRTCVREAGIDSLTRSAHSLARHLFDS